MRTASSWWSVSRCRAPVVTISWGGLPGIHQASGYSSSRTSSGPREAGSPAGRSGARSRRWARAWPRRRRASKSSRASIAVVQPAPHASSSVSPAAQGDAAERSYAAVTAGGAGAKTRSRTVWKTAAVPSTRAARQHSRTVATRHCHTHSATTGSRSGHAARVSTRGTGTAAARATALSRSRQTVMPWAPDPGRGTRVSRDSRDSRERRKNCWSGCRVGAGLATGVTCVRRAARDRASGARGRAVPVSSSHLSLIHIV